MPFNMQGWEWVILIVLALLIFGGSRLAGAGKNAGRALREFKDETRQIKVDEEKAKRDAAAQGSLPTATTTPTTTPTASADVVDAEVVEPVQVEKRDQA